MFKKVYSLLGYSEEPVVPVSQPSTARISESWVYLNESDDTLIDIHPHSEPEEELDETTLKRRRKWTRRIAKAKQSKRYPANNTKLPHKKKITKKSNHPSGEMTESVRKEESVDLMTQSFCFHANNKQLKNHRRFGGKQSLKVLQQPSARGLN